MKNSDIINKLMFDYKGLDLDAIHNLLTFLPNKLIRWLGIHHPDNRTRLIFFKYTNIEIGEDTVINNNFIVSDDYKPLLKIGSKVAISPNVTIICSSYPNNSELNNNLYVKDNLLKEERIIIEDNVWIGTSVVILPGVIIGKNSIVGSGSIITKDVIPNSIIAGVPGKLIRQI